MRAGCEGICCRCRWGICERHGPKQYDFKAYIELFKKAKKSGLKVQAVMSFHAGGGNVGDGSCDIPLPPWVLKVLADFGLSAICTSDSSHPPTQTDHPAINPVSRHKLLTCRLIQAVSLSDTWEWRHHHSAGGLAEGSFHNYNPSFPTAQAGELENDDIFYTDKRQSRDHECLSLGCDKAPILDGRTPLQAYADFIEEFAHQCNSHDLWGGLSAFSRIAVSCCMLIHQIRIGMQLCTHVPIA